MSEAHLFAIGVLLAWLAGIRVYLTARYSSPVELGKLKNADPLDPEVIQWWKAKADEIYALHNWPADIWSMRRPLAGTGGSGTVM